MKLWVVFILLFSTVCKGQERLDGTYDSKNKIFRFKNGNSSGRFTNNTAAYSDHHSNLMGLIDTTGLIIMMPRYYEIEDFAAGLARVTVKTEPWELTYGFIDALGNEILPPIYDDSDDWFYRSMRLAEVLVVGKDGKYGFFDYKGNALAPLIYHGIGDFRSGIAIVHKDGKAGFVNEQGKEIIPPKYDEAQEFGLNMALVKLSGKYGWIDTYGKTVIPFEYEWASNFIGDWAMVKKNGKALYIDRKGNPKLSAEYDGIGYYSNGLAWVHKGNEWGFIDSLGNVIIPLIYTKTGSFVKGRAWVWKDTKWGHINTKGKVTTPIIYDKASDFSAGYNGDSLYASVMLNGKYGKVGINGNLAIPCEYIGIDHHSMGLAKVKKQVGNSHKTGFVNYNGEEIIPCIYDNAERFIEGHKVTIVSLNGAFGLVNQEGKEIIPPKYSSIYDMKNGTYQVRDATGIFLINAEGQRIEK